VITNTLAQKKLGKVIKKFKPDIIHTNVGPVHIGYNIAKKMGIPHVWHIREYQNLDFNMHFFPTKKSFTRKLNSKFNYNIVITKGLFSYFDMQTNAKVIYDGIDCSNRILHGNKQKYFLFVGRLEGNKGIHDVINAFISFAKDNRSTGYKLLIAGDGKIPYVNKLHKIVKKANLTDRISFFGYRNDVYILMQSATALIVASKCEGFGLITIEAIMNGCLVIGKNAGGTKEILENDNIGILYSSHEELVAAMLAVVTNGIKSYHQIIKKAQQIASVSYTKERNCREVFNVYKRVLMIE
jgi:glycosyltransferase involved in cell wall biosynthesis